IAVDPALGGDALFRDPERVGEAEELVERALVGDTPPPGPSSAYARHAYEVSPSNQLAVKAADAVAAEPGKRYNPLFVDELIAALQEGSVERWRARYRAADALIIDDVHFVAGKERTQDELFHVFN